MFSRLVRGDDCLEIPAAFLVAAVAIEFNRVARTFTRGAAILPARLRWTGTTRVFTFVLVCHGILLNSLELLG